MKIQENENKSLNDFILARCNKKAAEKCYELALKTDGAGSVLFIQGPSSCGKTQLLYSTATLYCKEHNEEALLVSFHQMIDDFIKSIKEKDDKSFYNKYGCKKLLLIDDIQCISGLAATQVEFVRIFKQLVAQGVNVILFSEYKLNCYEKFQTGLQNETFFIKCKMRKADFSLRKKVLSRVLYNENVKVSDRIFYNIVLNKKIEVASMRGCVLKIKLMRTINKEVLSDKEIVRVLKEYER